ncbi:energy transducer TonB [Nitrobacter sp. JJSN]|uniref:energy transducer TonB n=1 Tax=Nitrobacter sp. JJSN TaxID=3453033 RepID=UPI003F77355B
MSHLDRYKRYPNAARAQRVEGTALLSFEMDRGGRVLTYYLVRSSGWPELDDEVLAMIERASPLHQRRQNSTSRSCSSWFQFGSGCSRTGRPTNSERVRGIVAQADIH